MAINLTTLFTRLGKGFYAQSVVNTARGSTVPPTVQDFSDEFNSASTVFSPVLASASSANSLFQQAGSAFQSNMSAALQTTLIQTVLADTSLPQADLASCLAELIRQMVSSSDSVDASTVSATPAAITGNGDGVLVASAKRADGKAAEHCFAETVKVECTADSSPETASFQAKGAASQSSPLMHDWPMGSGSSRTITATDATGSNLLTNGGFDTADTDDANIPDSWAVQVGTPGTTLKLTIYEVQRIVISGSPSAGTYQIQWTGPDSIVRTTLPLAYNASSSVVQAALQELNGLGETTVSTTGTTPNFTHDITFTGVAGNLSQVTVVNATTGGTFTISTTTGGSANAFVGRAMEFDSDGSQLTTLYQIVAVEPLKQYAVNLWALADVDPAAGVITVDLVYGVGGSVVADEAGTNNSFTIDCTNLTTSFVAKNGVFRTPRVLTGPVYFRVRITTAISSGTSVFLDHLAMVEMDELYTGGPSLSIFSGKTAFRKGAGQVAADYFTCAIANNRAGGFQEWFDRNFQMREKGLLLPSDTAGAETIADSLIG